jgi:Cu+-exporting ATPase
MSAVGGATGERLAVIDLQIGGMTCASCAARVERSLNDLDGVTASVNFALETARVEAPPGTDPATVVRAVEATGYTATPVVVGHPHHHGGDFDSERSLGVRVLIVAVLAIPVIAMGMIPALQFRGWQWLSLALTTPIVTWGAWPFHQATWANLRHRAATMDTLISLGVGAAYLWSLGALLFGSAGDAGMHDRFSLTTDPNAASSSVYFEVAAATTLFILLGRWFEARARRRGGDAIRALAELGAKDVSVMDGSRERRVPIDELRVGDAFVVRPGEKIATDGTVVEGSSAVDASLVTGESTPREVGPGDDVIGATVNAGGRLIVRANRVGADTTLARMAKLVADAQSGKAPVQRLADRVAGVFVPVVIVIAALTFGAWLALGYSAGVALAPAVAVLIVACPCALGLATPTALLAGTGRGAQLGVLIRGPEVLESTRRIDTIVLDKTGTVTSGRMSLVAFVAAAGIDGADALAKLASLEAASEHPIGRAIATAFPDEQRRAVTTFRATAGAGVEGTVDGVVVAAGRPSFLAAQGFTMDDELEKAQREAEGAGRTVVAVGWDGAVWAVAAVADTVRPSSAAAVAAFERLGLQPVLLTGDHAAAADAIAAEIGVSTVEADVRPDEKLAAVRRLQQAGRVVAMVGDGVNDAPALAQADLGLAMGSGADASIEAADITLVRTDLRAAADAIDLSRRTLRTIKANLAWAFGYNVAAIPLAAVGYLNPMLAGFAMAASSVLVVTNSLRLFRYHPRWSRSS